MIIGEATESRLLSGAFGGNTWVVSGKVQHRAKVWPLIWSRPRLLKKAGEIWNSQNSAFADSRVESTEHVSTGCFTIDEEAVLLKVNGTLPNSGRPGSHTVHGDLSCFVDTIAAKSRVLGAIHENLISLSTVLGCHSRTRSCTEADLLS